jgi:ABC-type amino acid transport substrate-binding protein
MVRLYQAGAAMRHVLTALVFFVLAMPAVAAPLTIMVEDASEPFSRRDGSGYANDLVRAAFKAAGIDVRLDVVPYARCKKSVEDGATPACFAMSWSPEMAGKLVFSAQPLFQVYADIFSNAHAKMPLASAADFRKGMRLGLMNGYEYSDTIDALLKRGVIAERTSDETALINMLARGRIDAAVVMTSDFVSGAERLAEAGMKNSVSFAYRAGVLQSHVGFSLKNPQGQLVRRAFDEGYATIISNGMRDKIRATWMQKASR